MKTGSLPVIFFLFLAEAVLAQEIKFLADRQGEFIVENQINKCPGFDTAAYSGNLKVIAEWFHKNNPVFNPPEGFDAIVTTGGNLCDDDRHSFYDLIKKEYSAFSSEELNNPASVSKRDGDISGIRADGEGSPVMKFNPECRDRTLPPAAIQFISLDYRPASEEELQQFIRRNEGLTDYVSQFMNKLPVRELTVLINRK